MMSHLDTLKQTHLRKITEPFEDTVILRCSSKAGLSQDWLFCIHPKYFRALPTQSKFPNPVTPPHFCLWLRKRVLRGFISEVQHLSDDVTSLKIENGPNVHFLIWEANGRLSNLLLLDENQHLLTAFQNPNQSGRLLTQGDPYQLPVLRHRSKVLPPDNMALEDQDAWVQKQQAQSRLQDAMVTQERHWKRIEKKLTRRLEKQHGDLERCLQWESWQQQGELLKSHLHLIQPGDTSVDVMNYYVSPPETQTLKIDPQKSKQQNLEHYFQKAQKLQKAISHVNQRLQQTQHEQEILKRYQSELSQLTSHEAYVSWQQALPAKWQVSGVKKNAGASAKAQHAAGPIKRVYEEGVIIWVGRNAKENEEVTFKIGRGNDWWFHAQGVSGSHVVVHVPSGKLSESIKQDAALLAAYYSKARKQGSTEVDYVQRKHVRKVKGGAKGEVIFSQNQSVYVSIDEERVKALLD